MCAGSHKANIQVPAHMRDLSKFVHPTIKPIPAKSGDCIIFTSVPALMAFSRSSSASDLPAPPPDNPRRRLAQLCRPDGYPPPHQLL